MFQTISDSVTNAETYVDALLNVTSYYSIYSGTINTPTWKDIQIPTNGYLKFNNTYFKRFSKNSIGKASLISAQYIEASKDYSFYYIKDTSYENDLLVKKSFSNADMNKVLIFSESGYNEIKDLPHVKFLDFKDGNDLIGEIKTRKKFSKINVFQIKDDLVYQSSQKEVDNCNKIKIVIPFLQDYANHRTLYNGETQLNNSIIYKLIDKTIYEIFCIKQENFTKEILDDKFEKYITLEDFVTKEYNTCNWQGYIDVLEASNLKNSYGVYSLKQIILNYPDIAIDGLDKLKSINNFKFEENIHSCLRYFPSLLEKLPKPTFDVEILAKKVYDKYPMLEYIGNIYYNKPELDKDIQNYIELINETYCNR